MKRIAIITTHPIQYNAPWFKLLAQRNIVQVKVYYTWGEKALQNKYDPGFERVIAWDIPLLEGYEYTFVTNISKAPGSHHFFGIDNPTLIKEIEEWKADSILVFGWSFKSHLKVIRHFAGKIHILFRGDSNLLDATKNISLKKIGRLIFLKWVYKHINTALYVGQANKDYYKKYGLHSDQLVYAPHAVDNERFTERFIESNRREINIPEEAIVFLFAGKMEEKKNPRLLLDAFIALDSPNTYLLMVGNGEMELQLKMTVSKQPGEIKERIRFLPFQNQNQMPLIYGVCDVMVLPSKGPGETWGLSVNEAMACCKPVLVSDKCGCAVDLVKEGLNGYIFKSNDCLDLITKMKMLLDYSFKLPEMGAQSLARISPFGFEKICMSIEKLHQ